MRIPKLIQVIAAGSLALGVAACADGYGRPGFNSSYDRYYGDPRGYSSVPYGYAGGNFGWSSGYYYPGTGNFVYDRRGQQRAWSNREQRYWQQRSRRWEQRDRRRR